MPYRKIAQEEYEATEAVCTKCGETKSVEEFVKAKTSLGQDVWVNALFNTPNKGLGQFDHDIDLLMTAVAYLIKAGEA